MWHPQSSGIEDGQALERMLQGRTPAGSRLTSITLKQGEDVYVVSNPGQENVHTTGNSPGFRIVRSKPIFMSKQLQDAEREMNDSAVVPFCRFAVQLRVLETLSAAAATTAVDKMVSYKEPFAEGGEVLAQALQLSIGSKDASSASIMETLETMPLLLYHGSNRLIREVFPSFFRIFRNKWNKVLEVDNKYDPPHIAEVKQMLLHMFLAGPEDIHMAVVREDQLTEVEKMVSTHTHHQYVRIHVERANLQVVFRQLKRLNSFSGIVIISLHVQGNLSPLDLGMIMEQTRYGSLRIFVVFFQQLLYSLQVIGRKKDVLVAQSLEGVHFVSRVTYDKGKDVVGSAVMECEDFFSHEPWQLRLDDAVAPIEKLLMEGTKWQSREAAWRGHPMVANPIEAEKSAYGVLVGDVSIVQQYYEALQAGELKEARTNAQSSLIIMDWLKQNADDIVENYLPLPDNDDSVVTPMSTLGRKAAGNSDLDDPTSTFLGDSKVPCVVVLHANLLSDALRRHIASRVMILGYRMIFVVPIFHPRDKYINVEEYNKAQMTLSAQVWSVEPSTEYVTKMIDEKMNAELAENDVSQAGNGNKFKRQALLIYRAIRLIAGSKLSHAKAISLVTKSVASSAREKMLISEISSIMEDGGISRGVLNDVLRIVFAYSCDYIEIESGTNLAARLERDLQQKTLHEFLAVLCVQKCFRSVWQIQKEIPFDQFVTCTSVCQWLSQRHRIEAWVRTLLLPDTAEPEHIVSTRFPPGDNTHSLLLLSYTVSADDKRHIAVQPSFEAVERHSTVRQSDLFLQQCMQGNELNWTELCAEWRVFPFSLDFLFELLRVYHQPLKLLSCIGLSNLHSLFENATSSRHGDVISRIATQVSYRHNALMLSICERSSSNFGSFISVLKWCLLSNGHSSVEELQFNAQDIEHLLERHIPIKIKEQAEETTRFVIPIIVQLDGPMDLIFKVPRDSEANPC